MISVSIVTLVVPKRRATSPAMNRMDILTSTNSPLRPKKKLRAKPRWKHARSKLSAATANSSYFALFIGFSISLAAANAATPVTTPDLILKNGKVYTDPLSGPSEGQSHAPIWSQAISIRDGVILSIGSNKAVERDRSPITKVIDLNGKVVLPGFNDAHANFINGGLALTRVALDGIASVAQLQERVKTYAAMNASKKWILGQGWDPSLFPGKKYPTKLDLDAAISDRPTMLWSADHHAVLLNSKALEALNISATTTVQKSGETQKSADGDPTGILLEEAAFEASHRVDNPNLQELKQAFLKGQEIASRFGVTSIQGGPIRGEDEIRAIAELYGEKKLHVRYAMWGELEKPREFLGLKEKYQHIPEEWMKFDAAKGYIDGVLGSRTAALNDSYSDDPKTRGEPRYTQDRLNELVLNANRMGLPVVLHAIGDRAVGVSVAALGAAKRQLFNSRLRNRVEHIEVAPPFVFSKFGEYRIVAAVEPSHMVYETEAQSYNEARLGPVRIKNAFALRSLLVSGARLAFGTDWPVESLNPMLGLFAATTRQHLDGKPASGWQPQQKLALQEAIDAYTLGSAYATHEEHVKGSLREGKYADLVVLNQDPFKARDRDLLKIEIVYTISGGKIVYNANEPTITSTPQKASPSPGI